MVKEKIKDAVYTRRYIYNFHYHLIWMTKYRHKTFVTDQLSEEMKQILSSIAKDNNIVIEKMEVMPDHVHVLISFPPSKAPASAIKALKGRSAYIFLKRHPEIKQSQYWGGHLWSPSYYMSTLGNMSKEVVEKYINDQKYHDPK
jgi:putative transposase